MPNDDITNKDRKQTRAQRRRDLKREKREGRLERFEQANLAAFNLETQSTPVPSGAMLSYTQRWLAERRADRQSQLPRFFKRRTKEGKRQWKLTRDLKELRRLTETLELFGWVSGGDVDVLSQVQSDIFKLTPLLRLLDFVARQDNPECLLLTCAWVSFAEMMTCFGFEEENKQILREWILSHLPEDSVLSKEGEQLIYDLSALLPANWFSLDALMDCWLKGQEPAQQQDALRVGGRRIARHSSRKSQRGSTASKTVHKAFGLQFDVQVDNDVFGFLLRFLSGQTLSSGVLQLLALQYLTSSLPGAAAAMAGPAEGALQVSGDIMPPVPSNPLMVQATLPSNMHNLIKPSSTVKAPGPQSLGTRSVQRGASQGQTSLRKVLTIITQDDAVPLSLRERTESFLKELTQFHDDARQPTVAASFLERRHGYRAPMDRLRQLKTKEDSIATQSSGSGEDEFKEVLERTKMYLEEAGQELANIEKQYKPEFEEAQARHKEEGKQLTQTRQKKRVARAFARNKREYVRRDDEMELAPQKKTITLEYDEEPFCPKNHFDDFINLNGRHYNTYIGSDGRRNMTAYVEAECPYKVNMTITDVETGQPEVMETRLAIRQKFFRQSLNSNYNNICWDGLVWDALSFFQIVAEDNSMQSVYIVQGDLDQVRFLNPNFANATAWELITGPTSTQWINPIELPSFYSSRMQLDIVSKVANTLSSYILSDTTFSYSNIHGQTFTGIPAIDSTNLISNYWQVEDSVNGYLNERKNTAIINSNISGQFKGGFTVDKDMESLCKKAQYFAEIRADLFSLPEVELPSDVEQVVKTYDDRLAGRCQRDYGIDITSPTGNWLLGQLHVGNELPWFNNIINCEIFNGNISTNVGNGSETLAYLIEHPELGNTFYPWPNCSFPGLSPSPSPSPSPVPIFSVNPSPFPSSGPFLSPFPSPSPSLYGKFSPIPISSPFPSPSPLPSPSPDNGSSDSGIGWYYLLIGGVIVGVVVVGYKYRERICCCVGQEQSYTGTGPVNAGDDEDLERRNEEVREGEFESERGSEGDSGSERGSGRGSQRLSGVYEGLNMESDGEFEGGAEGGKGDSLVEIPLNPGGDGDMGADLSPHDRRPQPGSKVRKSPKKQTPKSQQNPFSFLRSESLNKKPNPSADEQLLEKTEEKDGTVSGTLGASSDTNGKNTATSWSFWSLLSFNRGDGNATKPQRPELNLSNDLPPDVKTEEKDQELFDKDGNLLISPQQISGFAN